MHLCVMDLLYAHGQVMRIGKAWRVFQSITGCPTMGGITMEQYVAHYGYGR